MRLLYVTDQLALHGGIEKMLALKINHLISDYGYEVMLCTSEQRGRQFIYEINPGLRHTDLQIDYAREKSYFHPVNLVKSLRHYTRLRNLVKTFKPDVIISVNYTPEQFFVPFIGPRIPKVKEFHSSGVTIDHGGGISGMLKKKLFGLFARYDAQVVLNRDELQYYPFGKMSVIPNFIEQPSETFPEMKRDNVVLSAGRIAAVKQYDHLIMAWSRIADRVPDWSVAIYGEGQQAQVDLLQQLINEHNIPRIRLAGATSELNREMRRASVFAMTSSSECFPMVLLEAQQNGLPILSYDCPNGPRNIIAKDEDGWLTPAGEIGIFADQLLEIIQNDALRLQRAQKASENVVRFNARNVMEQWQVLFMNLVSEKNG